MSRDADGQRLYVLLALFDTRDGSELADLVRAAREGWERSHPDMAEDDAWAEFDARWARRSDERYYLRRTGQGITPTLAPAPDEAS
jgi:hypothetical protein